MSVSLVARQEGVSASLLFTWRELDREGALVAVGAGEAVVPASELAAARAEIGKPWRSLLQKSGLRARPCCPGTTDEVGLLGAERGALESACAASPVRRLTGPTQWPHAGPG